eukprot:gene12077-5570_t
MKLQTLLFLVFFSVIICKEPAVKITLNNNGIDFIKNVSVAVVKSKLSEVKFPPFEGVFKFLIDYYDYKFTNLKIAAYEEGNPKVKIVKDSSILFTSNQVQYVITFNWWFRQKNWPNIQDGGHGHFHLWNCDILTNIQVKRTEEGKINFFISNLRHSIGNIGIQLSGGASWIYNIFLFIFRERIRAMVEEQITKTVYTVINDLGNEQLNEIPYIWHFRHSNVSIDYRMISKSNYEENHLTVPFIGEFYYSSNRVQPDYKPRVIPDYVIHQKKINFILSDYFFKTAGDIYHQNGLLNLWITDNDVPPDSPVRLNTSSFRLIIPGLYDKYPNYKILFNLKSIERPKIIISPSNASLDFFCDMEWHVVKPGIPRKLAFTLTGVLSTAGFARLKDNKFVGKLFFLKQEFKLKYSDVGNVNVWALNTLMNFFFDKGIIPFVNSYLDVGVQLPTVPSLDLIEPIFQLGDGYIAISTDLKFHEPNMNEKCTRCIAWKNNYIKINNVTDSPTNELIEIEAFSKSLTGWFGIGFSENITVSANSILIFAKSPNTIFQLNNHTAAQKNQSQLISPSFLSDIQYILADKKGFKTYINVTNLKNMNYVIFASGQESYNNHFAKVIKYDVLAASKDFSFESGECSSFIGVPGRIFAYHLVAFYIELMFFIFISLVYLYFRNYQPLASRNYAPLFVTVGFALNLISEAIKQEFDFEFTINN